MINLYDTDIDENILRQMYNILIENLFITYPEFLKEKSKHDNKENYDKWTNMIRSTKNYKVIAYTVSGEVIGFLNYCIIGDELWISEVQVKDNYKNNGILKKLIREFVSIEEVKKYDHIIIHINNNNELSKKVFTHIGFKSIGKTLYRINLKDMKEWIET